MPTMGQMLAATLTDVTDNCDIEDELRTMTIGETIEIRRNLVLRLSEEEWKMSQHQGDCAFIRNRIRMTIDYSKTLEGIRRMN